MRKPAFIKLNRIVPPDRPDEQRVLHMDASQISFVTTEDAEYVGRMNSGSGSIEKVALHPGARRMPNTTVVAIAAGMTHFAVQETPDEVMRLAREAIAAAG